MKKLMIAAAAAAMFGGAYASNCEPPAGEPEGDCAQLYKVTLNVKTTKGVAVAGKDGKGSQCLPGEAGACYVYRTKDSTKLEGWLYDCACGCEIIEGADFFMWDSKRKAKFSTAELAFDFINVIGKKQADAETAWNLTGTVDYDETRAQEYSLRGAGFGKYSAKKAVYTSLSGNFAGIASASFDLKTSYTKAACACDPSQIWKCSTLDELMDENTVAYGTWTIKYNATASKNYAKNGKTPTLPKYVTWGADAAPDPGPGEDD